MSAPDDAPVFYTVEEVAAILRLPSTRWLERNTARLPHTEIARQRLFTRAHVLAIAKMHERNPEGDSATRPAFASQVTRGAR